MVLQSPGAAPSVRRSSEESRLSRGIKSWVLVKGLNLIYHDKETILTTIYIYMHIYISPLWYLKLKFLSRTQNLAYHGDLAKPVLQDLHFV